MYGVKPKCGNYYFQEVSMSRYIDADNLQRVYKEIHGGKRSLLIDTEPTADVVEVVRCKDCRWKQGSECVRFADVRPFPDDFCSRAERRTDEQIH